MDSIYAYFQRFARSLFGYTLPSSTYLYSSNIWHFLLLDDVPFAELFQRFCNQHFITRIADAIHFCTIDFESGISEGAMPRDFFGIKIIAPVSYTHLTLPTIYSV